MIYSPYRGTRAPRTQPSGFDKVNLIGAKEGEIFEGKILAVLQSSDCSEISVLHYKSGVDLFVSFPAVLVAVRR